MVIPRKPNVDREALSHAWEFAEQHGPSGPPELSTQVTGVRYTKLGRFLERREPFWALRNDLPRGRLQKRPPRGGYDEYGLDGSTILTVTRYHEDQTRSHTWVTPPADLATIALFNTGGRLASVGVYRSEAGRLVSAQFRTQYAEGGETSRDERYYYDSDGRVVRIESARNPAPWVEPGRELFSYWADYHIRYDEAGEVVAIGQYNGRGVWGSLVGTFDPDDIGG